MPRRKTVFDHTAARVLIHVVAKPARPPGPNNTRANGSTEEGRRLRKSSSARTSIIRRTVVQARGGVGAPYEQTSIDGGFRGLLFPAVLLDAPEEALFVALEIVGAEPGRVPVRSFRRRRY